MLPDIRRKESLTRLSRLATVQRQDNACGGDGGVADVQSHTIVAPKTINFQIGFMRYPFLYTLSFSL